MNQTVKIIRLLLLVSIFTLTQARADDHQDVKRLIHNLFQEDAKALLCADPNGDTNKHLIAVPQNYFSLDFMKYYKPVCTNRPLDSHGYTLWLEDPRTGQAELFSFADSKADFSNLKIGQPKIIGHQARIRVTYDFPDFSYKAYGNFTFFTLIKENDRWKIDDIQLGGYELANGPNSRPTKSLKQHIKRGLLEAETKKNVSGKRVNP